MVLRFMDNQKDDLYYIQKVLDDLTFLISHTKGISKESFSNNEILQDSVMFRFIQISEHIKKLTTEFKIEHKNIPWHSILGLRNRIVHEYGNVDITIVYQTIQNGIYELYDLFISLTQ